MWVLLLYQSWKYFRFAQRNLTCNASYVPYIAHAVIKLFLLRSSDQSSIFQLKLILELIASIFFAFYSAGRIPPSLNSIGSTIIKHVFRCRERERVVFLLSRRKDKLQYMEMQGNCFRIGLADSDDNAITAFGGRLRLLEVSRPWRGHIGQYLRNHVMEENKVKSSCCGQSSYSSCISNSCFQQQKDVLSFSILLWLLTPKFSDTFASTCDLLEGLIRWPSVSL